MLAEPLSMVVKWMPSGMVVQLGPIEGRVVLQRLQDLAAVGFHQQPDLRKVVLGLRVAQRDLAKELARVRRAVEPEGADQRDEQHQQAQYGNDQGLDLDVLQAW
jgi:hypothetical protein